MIYLTAFCASFAFIFLKAFQQRNVAFDNYAWVLPTSIAMAATEIYVIWSVAHRGWSILLVVAIGCGSGLGALAAMWIHKRVIMRAK